MHGRAWYAQRARIGVGTYGRMHGTPSVRLGERMVRLMVCLARP